MKRITKNAGRAVKRAGICQPQSGQSLLEVALMLPIILVLVLGVIEMARFGYIGVLVGNAAHAGAFYGAQSLAQSVDNPGIQTAALNDFHDNTQDTASLTLSSVNSSVACGCDSGGTVAAANCTGAGAGTCAAGHWVVTLSVTATGTFNSLFHFPHIPTSVTISRTSSLRVGNVG
jgi:Flp pilus assembly protein TadG